MHGTATVRLSTHLWILQGSPALSKMDSLSTCIISVCVYDIGYRQKTRVSCGDNDTSVFPLKLATKANIDLVLDDLQDTGMAHTALQYSIVIVAGLQCPHL